jgi:2-oxoisovalerate dehydrogenase E2 component (dihydrolipoyl transacylase)
VVAASIAALRKNPTFNAHWTDRGLVAKRAINVGVAVAVADGLLVPVIRDADRLSIVGLNRAIADVAARARAGKLRLDDFGGGTFTVDNTGWLGSALTLPIVNVPEVAILTMEAITKRAVVVETPDGDGIAIRSMMNMVIGFDHRAHDGAGAAALLRDVKAWLESVGPETPAA